MRCWIQTRTRQLEQRLGLRIFWWKRGNQGGDVLAVGNGHSHRYRELAQLSLAVCGDIVKDGRESLTLEDLTIERLLRGVGRLG